jgi:hypothetical protein
LTVGAFDDLAARLEDELVAGFGSGREMNRAMNAHAVSDRSGFDSGAGAPH